MRSKGRHGTARGQQRLRRRECVCVRLCEGTDLGDPREEAQRDASDVLIRVLEVVPQVLADENHLRQELAGLVRLLNHLKIQQQKLLYLVIVAGQNIPDQRYEERRELLAVEQHHDALLQCLGLRLVVLAL